MRPRGVSQMHSLFARLLPDGIGPYVPSILEADCTDDGMTVPDADTQGRSRLRPPLRRVAALIVGRIGRLRT